VYNPNEAPPPPSPAGEASGRNPRYVYLVGRLRTRQITMEEATELFALMQAMLRASEAARLAAPRPPAPPPPSPMAPTTPPPPPPAPPATGSDDLLLVGILAMGAGAGLLAALSRRIEQGPTVRPDPTAKSP